jgi:hypothetical protein
MTQMAINLEIGKTYQVKLTNGTWVKAKLEGDAEIGGYTPGARKRTRYLFRNLTSRRLITIKSMRKIRPEGA